MPSKKNKRKRRGNCSGAGNASGEGNVSGEGNASGAGNASGEGNISGEGNVSGEGSVSSAGNESVAGNANGEGNASACKESSAPDLGRAVMCIDQKITGTNIQIGHGNTIEDRRKHEKEEPSISGNTGRRLYRSVTESKMNVFHVLGGIVLYMCLTGICAQPDGKRKRGRIITRIHSNELVIPLHHQQNAIDMKTGEAYASDACGPNCPPPWIGVIHNLAGLNPNVSEPVCEFTNVFRPCSVEGEICGREPVTFKCCPTRCLSSVKACYYEKLPEFLCVPKTVQPWLQTLYKLNIWG